MNWPLSAAVFHQKQNFRFKSLWTTDKWRQIIINSINTNSQAQNCNRLLFLVGFYYALLFVYVEYLVH